MNLIKNFIVYLKYIFTIYIISLSNIGEVLSQETKYNIVLIKLEDSIRLGDYIINIGETRRTRLNRFHYFDYIFIDEKGNKFFGEISEKNSYSLPVINDIYLFELFPIINIKAANEDSWSIVGNISPQMRTHNQYKGECLQKFNQVQSKNGGYQIDAISKCGKNKFELFINHDGHIIHYLEIYDPQSESKIILRLV